ncbi:TetR/AcrR family transcriptional regulator [Streptomyces sp. NBC_01280]|uniref:TetR/AcrR family transcriptional regulator n=1 Tax=unclassified Streptomyces TaxID=2593676 RepID=UPI002E3241E9|nr:TetR/AcrR family transcriptional regulator [Streptomyces sp. NBC_01280]WSE11975.1 TetR/AcrR family transcriptional regulator [Streptomyces sp. NBC_01397]WSE19651.1 TetR/AcrR family transcriptional regulator [Streptomyces sp. NBC_01397]
MDAGVAWRTYSASGLPPILETALACFMEHGYHGTTIRTVASRAELSVPGLYYHYASKQALLVAIVSYAMDDLWERSTAALEEAGTDIQRRLDLLVECLVLFHAYRRDLAFIAYSEIRSLTGEARTTYIAARDRQQRLMDHVIEDGVTQKVFTTAYPREVSRAIVTMCTGVSQWYRAEGEHTPQALAERYRAMTRMTVGAL